MKPKGPTPDLIVFVAASLFATVVGIVLEKALQKKPPKPRMVNDEPPQE